MRLCKKIIIDLTDDTLSCRLADGNYYNLQGPSVVGYRKIGQNKIKVVTISYHVDNIFMNKKGASGIYLEKRAMGYMVGSAYWDSLKITIKKTYYFDGSIQRVEYLNRVLNECKIKVFDIGELYDNVIKQYNDKLPKIKELFNLAGKDYEIEPFTFIKRD